MSHEGGLGRYHFSRFHHLVSALDDLPLSLSTVLTFSMIIICISDNLMLFFHRMRPLTHPACNLHSKMQINLIESCKKYKVVGLKISIFIYHFHALRFRTCRGDRVSSVYFLVRHLATSGLLVSCLFLPVEVKGTHVQVRVCQGFSPYRNIISSGRIFQMGWIEMDSFSHLESWAAEDGICRIRAFLSNAGLYLTSFLIACIALDRCLAVLRPLQVHRSVPRAKKMLLMASVATLVCCALEVR